jgi:hypothetical protein
MLVRSNWGLNQERRNLMLHSHLRQHRRTLRHPTLIPNQESPILVLPRQLLRTLWRWYMHLL